VAVDDLLIPREEPSRESSAQLLLGYTSLSDCTTGMGRGHR